MDTLGEEASIGIGGGDMGIVAPGACRGSSRPDCGTAAPAARPVVGGVARLKTLQRRPGLEQVPSTVKCSAEISRAASACASTAWKKRGATAWLKRRSRFLVKLVASNAGVSTSMSMNHLNNRLYCSCSQSWRSLRIEYKAINRQPLNKRSGRDARSTIARIHRVEDWRQLGKRSVDDHLDPTQRVIRRYELLGREGREHRDLLTAAATHGEISCKDGVPQIFHIPV